VLLAERLEPDRPLPLLEPLFALEPELPPRPPPLEPELPLEPPPP
jgi:hypothetical protein